MGGIYNVLLAGTMAMVGGSAHLVRRAWSVLPVGLLLLRRRGMRRGLVLMLLPLLLRVAWVARLGWMLLRRLLWRSRTIWTPLSSGGAGIGVHPKLIWIQE